MMIVWDARQGTPVRTYFADQVGTGLRDAVISHDGMYLVTLGAAGGGAQGPGQVVAVWDWTAEDRETPLAMAAVKVGSDSLTCLRCHPENPRQLVANGASTVGPVPLRRAPAAAISPRAAGLHAPSPTARTRARALLRRCTC